MPKTAQGVTRFAAASLSGTRYLWDGERMLISERWEEPRIVYPKKMAVLERDSIDYVAMDRASTRAKAESDFWDHVDSSPWNDRPEIGKLLYVAGGDEWELSTPVAFVYFIGEDASQAWTGRKQIGSAAPAFS